MSAKIVFMDSEMRTIVCSENYHYKLSLTKAVEQHRKAEPSKKNMSATLPVTRASDQSSDEFETAGKGSKRPRKRRRLRYNAAYHELFQSTADEITSGGVEGGDSYLQPSQVGLTLWSPEEKETLFMVVSKKGKDDLKAIAEAIGSKSEPEVHVYLQLLQGTSELQHHHGSVNVPAAFEVSEACTDVLDAAADAILAKEQELDEGREREVFGDLWLLDEALATTLGDPTEDSETFRAVNDHPQLLHALEILNLQSWLDLSSRIFMNPRDLTDNWRSYADKDQTPSIYASAFLDFHHLVVTVTKRLVSSAIFFAKSRLRVKETKKHGHGNNVRQEDVIAAVGVLGMEPDAIRFWHGAARRCRTDVYEGVRIRKCLGKYSYEEVERILIQPEGGVSSVPVSPYKEHIPLPGREKSAEDEIGDEDSDLDSTHESRDAEISGYAESLDLQASHEEEQHLWDLFPQILNRPLQTDFAPDLPKRKRVSPASEDEASNWRDYMDYQRPWQRYKTPVPLTSFARNRALYQRKPAFGSSGDIEDLSECTRDSEEQDRASPRETGWLDGAMDELRSDGERAEAESEAGPGDDEEQGEEGQSNPSSDAGKTSHSPAHYDHEMRDADDEDDGHRRRGRSVKRSGSAFPSSTQRTSPERDPKVTIETDSRGGMSTSESDSDDD